MFGKAVRVPESRHETRVHFESGLESRVQMSLVRDSRLFFPVHKRVYGRMDVIMNILHFVIYTFFKILPNAYMNGQNNRF